MTQNTIKASENPALANSLIESVLQEDTTIAPASFSVPLDTEVNLPGGYLQLSGEVYRTAEVKELNGRDEEAIAKVTNINRLFSTILSRGVIKIGDLPVTENLLDNLLVGDRDALLLGIYKATFGRTADINSFCNTCGDYKTVQVDIDQDIETKVLVDPINDRTFTVKGLKNEYLVTLPTGQVQKEIAATGEKNFAELKTLLLEKTLLQINGQAVYSKFQVQNLGLQDRNKISTEIAERNPGPQFEDVKVICPDCDSEVVVPITLGTLFRF